MQQQQARASSLRVSGDALAGSGGSGSWSALALRGDEYVNHLFDYQLLLRHHPGGGQVTARELLGKGLDVRVELAIPGAAAGSRARWIHGEISQVARVQADERGRVYAVRLRPWAWRASLRGQCRAWRDRTVPQVLQELLRGAGAGRVVLRLRERYLPRDYLVQFNQTDWDCFARMAAEWGINFWFEHRRGAHDLVLADDNSAWPGHDADWAQLRVGAAGDRPDHECLRRLRHGNSLLSEGWCGRDDDYTAQQPLSQFGAAQAVDGGAAAREQFHWRGQRGAGVRQPRQARVGAAAAAPSVEGLSEGALQAQARARLQALRQHVGRARGDGPVRGLLAGHRVRVHGHRLAALDTEWLVLGTRLCLLDDAAQDLPWPLYHEPGAGEDGFARNPFGGNEQADDPLDTQAAGHRDGEAGAQGDACGDAGRGWSFEARAGEGGAGRGWQLHTRVLLQRADTQLRPDLGLPKPRVWGMQSAVVAQGPGQAQVDGAVPCDELGRVHVHFPWDRAARDASRDAAPVPGSQARRMARATSPALRVAMPWAGHALGRMHVPRLGQELLVGFVDGEPERPVGLGCLYNAQRRPGWELPRGRALGGVPSRELPGSGTPAPVRGNHLLLDDTRGSLQAQFGSDHLHSSLCLGELRRVLRGSGREEERGQGAELRTDGHGLLHAGAGLLLCTHGPFASADPSDAPDAAGQAGDARHTARLLAQARRWHAALQDPAPGSLPQPATAPDAGLQADAPDMASPEGRRDLLLGAVRGLALASDQRAHVVGAAGMQLGAGRQIGLRAHSDLLAQGARGVDVLSHRGGMQLLAAEGPAHLHACAAKLDGLGDLGLELRSGGELLLRARRGLLLRGGQSFLRLGPAGIEYGGASFVVRCATLRLPGPG